ncbi:lysozyme [Psychrobacter sp. BF1]|uniref:lysozyme n=1 Tax=Psychrobacter sp. BF1 TaxID=2821147 RepID=UPI001C4E1D6A|nr:lysozyme [Psychrobacter sp. BF1]
MTHDEFFEWLKSKQDNGKLNQVQVDGMNELLTVVRADVLQTAISALNGWTHTASAATGSLLLSKSGADMMKRYEGFKSKPYIDMVGVPTIGYGNTYYLDRRKVRMTDAPLTEPQAAKLKQDIINLDFASGVNKLFADEIKSGKLNQNMFDALVSLAYNIGIGALSRSNSVTGNIHAGNYKAAADGFLKFNNGRVNGKLEPIPGLTRRRTEERALFLS